jgi:hypothetical protein
MKKNTSLFKTKNDEDKEEEIEEEDSDYNEVNSLQKKKSLKAALILILFFFLFLLISTILISNFLLMKINYNDINNKYLNAFVLQQANTNFKNFTNTLNIRTKIINNILIQSRILNTESCINLVYLGKSI